jgi:hypothetical protein
MRQLIYIILLVNTMALHAQNISIDTSKQASKWFLMTEFVEDDTLLISPPHPLEITYDKIENDIQKKINRATLKNRDTIYAMLKISKSGDLVQIRIIGGHYKDCINEVIRVIRTYKKWTPGRFTCIKNKSYIDSSYILLTIKL